jgi:hypothetical protein
MKSHHPPGEHPLLRTDYKPDIPHYPVEVPNIKSGEAYYFETTSGLRYEVLFCRKRDNFLKHIVNFSVLSEEFEDEYSETNRGEQYRVIATVVEIIRLFHAQHPYSASYEFCGEFKSGNEERDTSIRTLLYFRKAGKILHPFWEVHKKGNRVIASCKNRPQ